MINLDSDKKNLTLVLGEFTDYKDFDELINQKYKLDFKTYANVVGLFII